MIHGLAALILFQATSVDSIQAGISVAQASDAVRSTDGLKLEGTAFMRGIHQGFQIVSDGKFRYRCSIIGPLGNVEGDDGSNCWRIDHSGIPHPIAVDEKDESRLFDWVYLGVWGRADAPVKVLEKGKDSAKIVAKDGCVPAHLTLDPKTHLVTHMTYWSNAGEDHWSFGHFKQIAGRNLATHIVHTVGPETEVYDITSGTSDHPLASVFAQPEVSPNLARFDASVPPSVPIKRLSGYVFVKPKVNGKEVGWFFLDSGAGALAIDPVVAKRLGLPKIGSTMAAGVVATLKTPIHRAESLELGPLTIDNPVLMSIDLAAISKAFGLDIGGIVGYDFIARTSLTIDPTKQTVEIRPPGKTELPPNAKWIPIQFQGELPCLPCRFEGDHQGVFTLDTGSGESIDFTSPTVRKFGMSNGRANKATTTGGAGGTAKSLSSSLKWFEIGGRRLSDIQVGLQLTSVGSLASPYISGNIGAGILGRYRLVWDYQNTRMALIDLH